MARSPPVQEKRTWSEPFLVVAQTGHASTPASSHTRHRHRCRHGSSSTHAPPLPHDLHASLGMDAPLACAAGASPKQHDRASSASASQTQTAAPRGRSWSSVARRPAATASWLLATPTHAWHSAPAWRAFSSSSALRWSARSRPVSDARSRPDAARPTAASSARPCLRRASCSAARILSASSLTSASISMPWWCVHDDGMSRETTVAAPTATTLPLVDVAAPEPTARLRASTSGGTGSRRSVPAGGIPTR
uniref:Uncharacterized protein n=1 Tax=Zea mays TaxID=4577 RepID=C0P5X9_MAIZE|nr:unknown [Zea mays]